VSCSPLAAIPGPQPHAPAPAGELTTLDTPIRCERLHATLAARCCVVRQRAAARGRTLQASRGQGTLYPSCDGCPQGLAVREAVDGAAAIEWHGRGPGGRFDRGLHGGPRSWKAQRAARRRLRLVGLLDIPPCLDEPPEEADEASAAAV
jgi:hypothetical protein